MNKNSPKMHRIDLLALLGVLLVSGCADSATAVRAHPQTTAPTSKPESERAAAVPNPLRGVWHQDSAEGRASCRTYLAVDAANIERTGQDPMVGALVISRRVVHVYSEYGEGNFFLIVNADQEKEGVWTLSAQLFLDSFPAEGEHGDDVSERFELSKHGALLSSVASGKTFFRCGDVRSDLYGLGVTKNHVATGNEDSDSNRRKTRRITKFPKEMLGVWSMGETSCSLPVNPDADGALVVSESKMQGYEFHVMPKKISILSEVPLRIKLDGTEVYLGSQSAEISQTIVIDGDRMTLTEGRATEIYTKCR
jgi:hypothetical protein